MTNNDFNSTVPALGENEPGRRFDNNVSGQDNGASGKRPRKSLEELAAELDELAAVPTDVLADWVTARGRCLWESTFGEPPEWTGEQEPGSGAGTPDVRGLSGAVGVSGVRGPRRR